MHPSLPERPHPDHLRRQARDLLRQWRAAEPAALQRLQRSIGPALPAPQLSRAQWVIAREHGFASWPALLQAVEEKQAAALSDDAYLKRWLRLVMGGGDDAPQPQRAEQWRLARPPKGWVAQLVLGHAQAVQAVLEGPGVHAPLPPLGLPALACVAFSSMARLPQHAPALEAAVATLLQHGADPNTAFTNPEHPGVRLPVLYGAVARAQHLGMVQLLLQAGADPNDNETLYHATEQRDRRLLEAVCAAGARWPETNALFRQLDHDDLPGLQQCLHLGADTNELSPSLHWRPLQHALQRGRDLAHLQALHAAGADPTLPDRHGHDTAWHAARCGAADVLLWLQGLGFAPQGGAQEPPGTAPAAAFVHACARGDGTAAHALLAAQPGLLSSLPAHDLRLLPDQAQRGRLDAVALMLQLGWPVATPGDWGASALNQAAFRGDATMVALLLQHGARWHEPNAYGGTALGSCLHAACHLPQAGGDYARVLSLLLDDGAPLPPEEEQALWPDALVEAAAQR